MPIPDYQTLMLPILQIASDGQERRNANIYSAISEYFKLSDADKRELLPDINHTSKAEVKRMTSYLHICLVGMEITQL